jgi:hypothetical protein
MREARDRLFRAKHGLTELRGTRTPDLLAAMHLERLRA